MRLILAICITGLLLLLLACGDDSPSSAAEVPPIFDLVEELRIKSDESSPESSLTEISSLTVLSDGSMATFHGMPVSLGCGGAGIGFSRVGLENKIRVFDSNGRFTRIMSGTGEGPSEFTEMGLGGSVGESLWATNKQGGKTTVFSRNGELQWTRTPTAAPQSGGRPILLAVLARNRNLAVLCYSTPGQTQGVLLSDQDSVAYLVVDSLDAVVARIAVSHASAHKTIRVVDGRGPPRVYEQPYAGKMLAAASDGGAHFVVASDAEIWGGKPGLVRLLIGGSDGRIVQKDISFHPVRMGYVNRSGPNGSQLYVPEFVPVLSAVKVGRDGSIWISPTYERSVWRVIVDGRVQMRVRSDSSRWPPAIKSVSKSNVWAVAYDSLLVPFVVRYALVPKR